LRGKQVGAEQGSNSIGAPGTIAYRRCTLDVANALHHRHHDGHGEKHHHGHQELVAGNQAEGEKTDAQLG
jgi:hypothetical protein